MTSAPVFEMNSMAPPRRSSVCDYPWPVGAGNYWVSVATSAAELAEHRDRWEELARAAVEPNPFYEPWMLLPALEQFGGEPEFRILLVYYRDHRPQEPPRLCGLFPCVVEQHAGRFRPAVYTLWGHSYCFLRTPLIRHGVVRETWNALWDWLATDLAAPDVLRLERTHGEGPLHQALLDLFRERQVQFFVQETTTRALLRPNGPAEDYINRAVTSSKRQQLRRLRRRLEESGRCEFRQLQTGDDLAMWLRQFLDLEAAGWKGDLQSAMKCREQDRQYLETVCREAFERQQLQLQGLFLDDVPVAMKLDFISGAGMFAFKVCFDETWSKFSVGVQLELESLRIHLEQTPQYWVDSCATPDHPLVNWLWLDRRTLQSVSFCGPRRAGRLYLSWLDLKRGLGRLLR